MPLLKKKKFEKAPLPENLRDDDKVFHCSITNEIFRDYEEFAERLFLCNSMVWTCSMTGKSGLTYTEALESERNAKRSIKEFPQELKIPILYLAMKTKRTAFGDMADDVFSFVKDRYFIGENVETCFTGNKWKDSHVIQVIAPDENQIKNAPKNGTTTDRHFYPPAALFKYEIEHLDADDKDISEMMIVDNSHIRRKKGRYSREKNKLFLKQYVEQNSNGMMVLKQSIIEKYNLNRVRFEQIFDGPLPDFEVSKKITTSTSVVNGKKTKQQSIQKFLTKTNKNSTQSSSSSLPPLSKNNLLEQMKKREEEFKKLKQQKKEEELAMKQKKREENLILTTKVKNWYKPDEDLELIDQKKLPDFTPIKSRVPDEYFGDLLMVMEFVHSFSKFLYTKDFFPGGLTVDIMERALMENEVAGPFIDLIQMLLTALFNVQEEEANQYTTQLDNSDSIKFEDTSNNLFEATRLATLASKWCKRYQGVPLNRLPLYPLTTSEILRLHLLSSGARINETGAKWRYQQRGGYRNEDDPGLYLRLNYPNLLKSLSIRNVVEFPIGDKLKILQCLIDQLLTYADVRDIIEERCDKVRQTKQNLKCLQIVEKRREQDFTHCKMKLKKERKDDPKLNDDLNKMEIEAGRKKDDNEYNIERLTKASYEYQILMGQDRAFRRYYCLESIPGIFINNEDDHRGVCLDHIVEQNTELTNATREDVLNYLKRTMQNDGQENCKKTQPKKINGVRKSLQQQQNCCDLLMCSTNPDNCVIHSSSSNNTKWSFLMKIDDLDALIKTLNNRGIRESELLQNLKCIYDKLVKIIDETPVKQLNSDIDYIVDEKDDKRKQRHKFTNKNKYDDANLGYSSDISIDDILHNTLIDNILEMEEKIHAGNLGSLLVKDRNEWRKILQNRTYKEFDKIINHRRDHIKNEESDKQQTNETITLPYNDPGKFLFYSTSNNNTDDNKNLLKQSDEMSEIIKCLSIAVAQLAQSVEPKYLKRPLGHADVTKYDKKKPCDVLDMWEQSLLSSTSFSQIFLHYSTLDSCVMWTRSILLARCRICRRANDSENMLLCDECNLGHHLYCLRPPLKSVPSGDWFCKKCAAEKKKIESKNEPEQQTITTRTNRKRPIFRDDDDDDNGGDSDDHENGDIESTSEEDEDNDYPPQLTPVVDLCKTCGSGGELISCDKCSSHFHIECVEPPLRRPPRGQWFCSTCKQRRHNFEKRYYNNGASVVVVQRTGIINGQRRCAAKALYKIHDFAKSLRQSDESEDSNHDDEEEEEEEEEEVINKRPTRRDDVRDDLPLHNAALHELLTEIMKDTNAWPFLRPVQKNEVPDYYDVIRKPMDFGTIKYKLNMGEYKEDAELMEDVLLVFENCNTYNRTDDDVYKCGVELLKVFQRKCRELGLKLPASLDSNNDDNDASEHPKKKRRVI